LTYKLQGLITDWDEDSLIRSEVIDWDDDEF